jgi:hypothetical protein
MTFQKRLQRAMRRRGMRTADLARWFDRPYTTVREWVLFGREPGGDRHIARRLMALEKRS